MLTRVVAVLALAIASMALFFALDLWLDRGYRRRFQQQATQPAPHDLPTWMAG